MEAAIPLRRVLPWMGLTAVLSFLAFAPALSAGFTNWDDEINFTNNPYYRGFTPETLRFMFTDCTGHYIPLTWLTLALDYALWGMNPAGYHLTNLLFHAANAALCFLVIVRLLRRIRPETGETVLFASAAAGALFFAVHPLRAESVAWVTERRDLTSGFFFLCALFAYLGAAEDGPARTRRLALVAGLFAGSLLCKATGMMLPFVLLVLDVYPLRRAGFGPDAAATWRRPLLEKLPLFVLMLGAVAITRYAQGKVGAMGASMPYPAIYSLIEPGPRLAFYVTKTLWPLSLSPMYYFRPEIGMRHLSGAVLVAGLTAAAWVARRRRPELAAAWVAFLFLIAPVSGVFHAGHHATADRYSYLPCLPFAALAGAACLGLLTRRPAAAGAIVLPLFAVLATLTWRQTGVWHDSIALWSHAIDVDPQDPVALSNRGKAWEELNRLQEARADYTRCLPAGGYWQKSSLLSRGTLSLALGDLGAARADLDEAIRLDATRAKAFTTRAIIREQQGDPEGALEDHDRAVALDPSFVKGFVNRGTFRSKRGDAAGAMADAEAAVRAQPGQSTGYIFRASLRRAAGDGAGAKADLDRAVELPPPSVEALNNRAGLLLQAGKAREALADYDRAEALQPGNLAVLVGRAQARRAVGDRAGAAADLERALRTAPPGWPLRKDFEAMHRALTVSEPPR